MLDLADPQVILSKMITLDEFWVRSYDKSLRYANNVTELVFDPESYVTIFNTHIESGQYELFNINGKTTIHIDARASKCAFHSCIFSPNIAYETDDRVKYSLEVFNDSNYKSFQTTFNQCVFSLSECDTAYVGIKGLVSVIVKKQSVVTFNECYFYADTNCVREISVLVLDGSKAIFNNCHFIGRQTNQDNTHKSTSIMVNCGAIECNDCTFEGPISQHINATNLSVVKLMNCRFTHTRMNVFAQSFVTMQGCSFSSPSGHCLLRIVSLKNCDIDRCSFTGKSNNLIQITDAWCKFSNCTISTTHGQYPVLAIDGWESCCKFTDCVLNAENRCVSVSKFASASFVGCQFHSGMFSVTSRMFANVEMEDESNANLETFEFRVHVPNPVASMPCVANKALIRMMDSPCNTEQRVPVGVCCCCGMSILDDALYMNKCGHFVCSDCANGSDRSNGQCCERFAYAKAGSADSQPTSRCASSRHSEGRTRFVGCDQCRIPIADTIKVFKHDRCCICLNNKPMVAFSCGHLCACIKCTLSLGSKHPLHCPFCERGRDIKCIHK